jgi:2-iminobutanoate/2-iminopropanoate deaminase
VSDGLREIRSTQAPAPVGPYSQAIEVAGFVFCAGQIPLDPATGKLVDGPVEVQAERVLANVSAVLEAAGTSLARVVKTTVFLVDLADFGSMNEVYTRWFTSDPKPARTTIQAARLPAGALNEIDAIARL